MTNSSVIDSIVHRVSGQQVLHCTDLGGGCIHDVRHVTGTGEFQCVLKIAEGAAGSMLHSEVEGLAALAVTGTVRTPAVLGLEVKEQCTVLMLEYLAPESSGQADWSRFGIDLARLHASGDEARYGFSQDNYLGRSPQCNGWHDDWVQFNIECRFGPQLAWARDAQRLDASQCSELDSIINRLDRYLPRRPRSSLLHGDLWSGNAIAMSSATVAVIDPACAWGDAWADPAMMRLFGGFPDACFDAWEATWEDHDQAADRMAVYQLYHLLNHLNLFGTAYEGQVMSVVRRLR